MTAQDLLITPFWLAIIYGFAFFLRGKVTDEQTKKYFIPALSLKIIGAISLGLIYQFYYSGGDTFNYFHHGSRWIYEAFNDSPWKGIKLILANGNHYPDTFQYSSRIWFYHDLPSYFVVRVAGVFDILTFHTYSATAALFAAVSFSGLWALYLVFYRRFPHLHAWLAMAVFFVPSVFFWGSGILKDTITIGSVGWLVYAVHEITVKKRFHPKLFVLAILAASAIYSIKIYILLCLLPAMMAWVLLENYSKIPSRALRYLASPLVVFLGAFIIYMAILKIGEDNNRYNLEKFGETAEVTARWLSHVSQMEGGSGYTLGDDFDFSPSGMVKKFPLAVWVSLFRPYVWEVKNPVMLLSALESLAMLFFTLYIIYKSGPRAIIKTIFTKPVVLFCLVFSIAFAFAVGFSTYNFGSLVRYKIPLIPFYIIGLVLIWNERVPKAKAHKALQNA